MTKDIEVMKFVYFNHSKIKDLSLSTRQVELISYLKRCQATSRDIADMYGICVQNASQQLNNLFRKGYLTRDELIDETGGYLFEYTTNYELLE